jgi:formate dehydrogenase major subunit
LYNRASADPQGKPWSEKKKYIWWDEKERKWSGLDVPDFELNKDPSYEPQPGAKRMEAISGHDPFIMHPDGKGWLFAPSTTKDGPLPAHYEPRESPVHNILYKQETNPTIDEHPDPLNQLAPLADSKYPIGVTTYRLTEHYLSGPMSRFNSWLNELQPEMFVEISPELAEQHGIKHGEWMVVATPRGAIEARAMVTKRMKPLKVEGAIRHQIGLPIHWGYAGEVTGAIANDLTSLITEPNVSMHEAKAFTCQIRAGRLDGSAPPKSTSKPSRILDDHPIPDTPPSAQPEGRQRRT